jgi:hypothetical protein
MKNGSHSDDEKENEPGGSEDGERAEHPVVRHMLVATDDNEVGYADEQLGYVDGCVDG